jgi:hypothetical protein
MTTKQIIEQDESGRAMPDAVMGGQGYIVRGRPAFLTLNEEKKRKALEPTLGEIMTYARVKPRVR